MIVTTSNRPPWELQDHGLHEVRAATLRGSQGVLSVFVANPGSHGIRMVSRASDAPDLQLLAVTAHRATAKTSSCQHTSWGEG